MIATAQEWKIPPLTMLGLEEGGWTETDRLLALAYHAYKAGLCSCCGFPARLAHNERMSGGWFEATETVCEACATKDRYRQDHEKDTPEPGLLIGLKDTRDPADQLAGKLPR